MEENIVISNKEKLRAAREAIVSGGAGKLHVLSDFDRTLTSAFVDGKSVPSLVSVLRDGDYLTKDYSIKAHALFDKYHAIEIDPKVSRVEKIEAMNAWWTEHFSLLIKSGLNRKHLSDVIKSGRVQLRGGCLDFLDLLNKNGIPLVIMSSSGLGGDVIEMYLRDKGRMHSNTYIISNSFEWDEEGNAVAVKQPIIHAMNKCETIVRDFPAFKAIEDRKNVLLLGDSLGDIEMISGFDCDNLIKIGFLNENVEESLEVYKANYDIVVLNDGDMECANALLKEIINKK